MGSRVGIALLVASLVLVASPALAADLDSAAEDLLVQGFHVEAGSGSSAGLADQIAATGGAIGLASFADDLGDATIVAEDLSSRTGISTVIVLTPVEIGVFSTRYSDGDLSRAIDGSLDAFDVSLTRGFATFVTALPGAVTQATTATTAASTPVTTATPTTQPATSSGGFPVGTILLVAIVGGGFFLWWRSRAKARQLVEDRVAEAKREVETQVAEISNEILDLSDRVAVSDSSPAKDSFQAAASSYDAAQRALESAATVAELEKVSDHLDEARYQLDVAEAHLDGRPAPERPREERGRCFFDPNHPRATETAVIRTAAGDKTVRVCELDAARLRRGQRPDVRGIEVDGRKVPAPQAPRSYGGGGLDWMDVFSVIVGGASAVNMDLGGRQRVPQRRTVYPPRPRASRSSSTGTRSVVPGPGSTRRGSGRRSSTAKRRSTGRASRSRGSHRASGKARRRR